MLKLTFADRDHFYADFVADPRVLKVRALSGGCRREETDERLSRHGVIASFSASDQGSDQGFHRRSQEGCGATLVPVVCVGELESLRP